MIVGRCATTAGAVAQGNRRFVTATESAVAPRSKAAPETLRASTLTV